MDYTNGRVLGVHVVTNVLLSVDFALKVFGQCWANIRV